MANLTIAVDEDLLRRARIRALELGTSVNAILREYLESFAGDDVMAKRVAIVETANQHPISGHTARRTWTRDDLHDR